MSILEDNKTKEMVKVVKDQELSKLTKRAKKNCTEAIFDYKNEYKREKELVLKVMSKKVTPNLNTLSEYSKSMFRIYQSDLNCLPIYNDLTTLQKLEFPQIIQKPTLPVETKTPISTEISEQKINNGQFIYNPETSILYYRNKEFMNCNIEIVEIVYAEKHGSYLCSVTINGEKTIKSVPVEQFSEMKWLKKLEGFTFLCNRNDISEYSYRYSQFLILNTSKDKKTKLYRNPGWIKVANKYYYITPNGVIGEFNRIRSEYGQSFTTLRPTDTGLRRYLNCVRLTKSPTAAILILYTAMCLCYNLFKEADLTPKFILFLNGKRGSKKTSISLALTQIEYKSSPKYILKATSAALEAGLRDYYDAVLLVDDLAPTHEKSDLTHMQSNLELLVRIFGDGTGKERNFDFATNPNLEQYRSSGGCIITGEYIVGCESSLARCLMLDLNEYDVNTDLLTDIQHNKKYVESFAVDFLYHLTALLNYNGSGSIIDELIRKNGIANRSILQNNFSNSRYCEYYAQLKTTVDLIMYVAKMGSLLTSDEIEYYTKYFDNSIEQVIAKNSKDLAVKSPDVILCEAIVYGVESGRFPVENIGNNTKNQMNLILEGKDSYYITQTTCSIIYEEYKKIYKINSPKLSPKEVGNILADLNIIVPVKEGERTRKSGKISGYGNTRFMKINKCELLKRVNNI